MKAIVAFLQNNVIGKMMYTPELVYELEGGELEGVYTDQISFAGLTYSQSMLNMDMFIVASERIYECGENGARGELYKDLSAISLFRYELARRRSTGQVTGSFRFVSGTGRTMIEEGTLPYGVISSVYDVIYDGSQLSWREDQALYRDQHSGPGRHSPVAFEAECCLSIEKGKLQYSYYSNCFDVDGITLRRGENGDSFPPFISREL